MSQDLQEIEKKAKHLIQVYCPEYTLIWMNRKRTLGWCDHHRKEIALSKHHAVNNPLSVTRDTVLHEIAHALAGLKAGHNKRWKAICQRIGAIPKRCAEDIEITGHKWERTCNCKTYKYFRKPKARKAMCVKCKAIVILRKVR